MSTWLSKRIIFLNPLKRVTHVMNFMLFIPCIFLQLILQPTYTLNKTHNEYLRIKFLPYRKYFILILKKQISNALQGKYAVYSKNHTRYTNAFYGQNAELFTLKARDIVHTVAREDYFFVLFKLIGLFNGKEICFL